MNLTLKPLAEINHEAMKALYDKLGIADSIRFINQFNLGYGNYTEDRKEFFRDLTLDDILDEIEKTKEIAQ